MQNIIKNLKQNIFGFITVIIGIVIAVVGLTLRQQNINFPEFLLGPLLFICFNLGSYMLILEPKKYRDKLIGAPILFVTSNLIISAIVLCVSNLIDTGFELSTIILSTYLFALILLAAGYLASAIKSNPTENRSSSISLLPVLLITIAFFITQFIFRYGVDFRTTLNLDTLHHLTGMKEIFLNSQIKLFLTDINPTFTVATYLPLFHYIFGTPVYIATDLRDTLLSFNVLESLFSLFSAFCVFLGVKHITKNGVAATVGAILHLFAFESFGAFTSFFLLPQTIAAIFGFMVWSYVTGSKKVNYLLLGLASIILILSHFYIGTVAVVFLGITLLIKSYKKEMLWVLRISVFLLQGLFALSFLYSVNVSSLGDLIFSDYSSRLSELVTLDNVQILNVLFRSFGFLGLFSIVLIVFSLFSKNWKLLAASLCGTLILFLIVIDFPYSNKLLVLEHYILILILASSVSILGKKINAVSLGLVFILMIGLVFNLSLNIRPYKDIFTQDDIVELVSENDYKVSRKLSKYPKELVVSDPMSMHVLEPIADIRTTGGIFTSSKKRIAIWKYLRGDIKKAEFIKSIGDENLIIVYTPRTFLWLNSDQKFIDGYGDNIWHPVYNNIRGKCRIEQLRIGKAKFLNEDYCIFTLN